jgi:hydrogenase-4 component B
MTFQALVLGGAQMQGASGLAAIVAASALALTGALAAACFVKAFGATFLGRPRSEHAAQAVEVAPSMRVAMVALAAVCAVVGIAPGAVVRLLDGPVVALIDGSGPSALVTVRGPLVLTADAGEGAGTALSLTAAAALFVLLAVLLWAVLRWRRTAPRLAPTWTCGMTPESRFDYTATSFAKPLRFIFAALYRPRRSVIKETGPNPYVLRRLRWEGDVVDLAETHLYHRLQAGVMRLARAIRIHSTGSIHGYIGYVLGTLLLILLAFGSG